MKNNDDTPTTDTNEIKQLINRINQGELDRGDALLIEKLLNFLQIALYFSSRRHAGENLDHVLERRSPSLPAPIKMSDASAVNGKKMAQTIDANCLAHGRGKFKELEEIFPVECGQVMEAIRKV